MDLSNYPYPARLPEIRTYGSENVMEALKTGTSLQKLRHGMDMAELKSHRAAADLARKQAEEERKRKEWESKRQFEAMKYGARLLHNIKDEATYQDARARFLSAYPEYTDKLPGDYDEETVKRMVGWGLAYDKMFTEGTKVNKLYKERSTYKPGTPEYEGLSQEIANELSNDKYTAEPTPDGGFKMEPKDILPKRVKQAQDYVLKFIQKVDPGIAALIASNPEMASKSPVVRKALDNIQVPDELKASYAEAVKIMDEYYGVKTPQDPYAGYGKYEFSFGQGLTQREPGVPVKQPSKSTLRY